MRDPLEKGGGRAIIAQPLPIRPPMGSCRHRRFNVPSTISLAACQACPRFPRVDGPPDPCSPSRHPLARPPATHGWPSACRPPAAHRPPGRQALANSGIQTHVHSKAASSRKDPPSSFLKNDHVTMSSVGGRAVGTLCDSKATRGGNPSLSHMHTQLHIALQLKPISCLD